MKKLTAALLIVLTSALIIVGIAFASGGVPPGVIPTLALLDLRGQEVMHWIWTFEVDGATCVFVDGELDCFCPCVEGCNQPSIIPTDKPPTDTPPTSTPPIPVPSETPIPVCQIWLCHKPGTAAEQDYCCEDSIGCRDAHLKHGDYLGKCE